MTRSGRARSVVDGLRRLAHTTVSAVSTLSAATACVALFATATLGGGAALAQTAQSGAAAFPSKPLRIVVPFGAGGIADLSTRSVAEHMAHTLGQPVVVDNKPGAGGVVAADTVAKAEPGGHTLLLMSNANAISHSLFKQLPYDTTRDFAPVGLIGTFDLVVVVPARSRYGSLDALIGYARANPGKLNIGTINIGSTQHLSAELFKSTFRIDAQVVPFNGTPAVISALRGNQIDAAFEILGPMLPQIQSGAVQALAVTGQVRDPALPEVRTVSEIGHGRFEVSSWNALAAPARTPPAAIARINQALAAALADPTVTRRLADLHVRPRPGSPADAIGMLADELQRWGGVIAKAGIPRQ
jgi:tripartite-type tricarboxylate transporter receptor subunit TctC